MESGKSCLVMLLIYGALALTYSLVFQQLVSNFAVPLALVLAVFGSLFVGSLISMVGFDAEQRLVKKAASTHGGAPADGSLVAITGRVAPTAATTVTPIRGQPAVAWDCRVYTRRRRASGKGSYERIEYRSMGRVPFTCSTRWGPVALSGLLDLSAFGTRSWRANEVKAELTTWSADPAFSPFARSWQGMSAQWEEFRTLDETYHLLRRDPAAGFTPEHRVEERSLSPGEEICAIGIYDSRRNALRGHLVLGVERVRVFLGPPRKVLARLRRKAWLGLAAMTFLFLLSHGLIFGVILWGREIP
ncbi:MAG: hypothetical protein MI919_01665 [Holophagales bacterium]|nr:hypothetical protein [Holophagales bacterium]